MSEETKFNPRRPFAILLDRVSPYTKEIVECAKWGFALGFGAAYAVSQDQLSTGVGLSLEATFLLHNLAGGDKAKDSIQLAGFFAGITVEALLTATQFKYEQQDIAIGGAILFATSAIVFSVNSRLNFLDRANPGQTSDANPNRILGYFY